MFWLLPIVAKALATAGANAVAKKATEPDPEFHYGQRQESSSPRSGEAGGILNLAQQVGGFLRRKKPQSSIEPNYGDFGDDGQ